MSIPYSFSMTLQNWLSTFASRIFRYTDHYPLASRTLANSTVATRVHKCWAFLAQALWLLDFPISSKLPPEVRVQIGNKKGVRLSKIKSWCSLTRILVTRVLDPHLICVFYFSRKRHFQQIYHLEEDRNEKNHEVDPTTSRHADSLEKLCHETSKAKIKESTNSTHYPAAICVLLRLPRLIIYFIAGFGVFFTGNKIQHRPFFLNLLT